ncbi:protein FAM200B-like [Tachypleus tridentatus]|uniref:protein FAM200B-like n=1 Tax=Tachypleus tridentatus TaxID=6853 RepID=UPI003FD1C188
MVSKSCDYFARKLKELKEQKDTFLTHTSLRSDALLSSYKVAYKVAKCKKKPDTIAEELILPVAVDMVNIKVGGAKAQDSLEILGTFMCENTLDWTKCVGFCTDGGPSMSGFYGGFHAFIRSKALDSLCAHCIIHREALTSKHSSSPLNLVLERYLYDLFEKLNSLNLSLQGSNKHILKFAEKISAFRKKVLLWKRKEMKTVAKTVDLIHGIKSVCEEHLTLISDWFVNYFTENVEKFTWIQDPFKANAPSEFTSAEEENLIELFCDNTSKTKFGSIEQTEF